MEEVQNPGSILNRISPSGVAWGVGIFAILVWAWHGAEIHPLQLLQDGGNIKTMAADFVPPDFSDWRDYVREMLVTIQVAVWGTLLAIICAVPLGILSASNIVPAWIYQPTRRLMDCSRAINEMIWAMLFGPWPLFRHARPLGAFHRRSGQAFFRSRGIHQETAC